MSTRRLILFCMVLLILPLAGCDAFLPKRDIADEGSLPATYSLKETEAATVERWWTEFESEELNSLVEESLSENLTLRQFWARVEQADARSTQAGALLYPQIDLLGDASYRRTGVTVETDEATFRTKLRDALAGGLEEALTNTANRALGQNTGSTTGGGPIGNISSGSSSTKAPDRLTQTTTSFGLSLSASYEVDLWGRIASGYRAAQLDQDATRRDLEATAITVVAEVVERWLRIQEQQALSAILEEQLETNRTFLELVELRFRKSQVSALDVYQQRQAVSEIERQFPAVESAEQVLRHELAVLLGRPPMFDLNLGSYDLQRMPEFPAIGVPADLLVRRPDVMAALADLRAADYRVAEARADQLPAIRLTGGIGYSADDIANVLDDWFLNLAAGIAQPLFDGYRRQAEVERTLAVVEERLAAYRLTILTAIREVEDALIQERKQRELIAALERQIDDAENALNEATERYLKAANDYLPVLTELERTQALSRSLVTARRELVEFRLDLYRALGGTWPARLDPPEWLSQDTKSEANES